ncbi:hypothetical protein C8R45DRAFT_1081201 [Mycena sanguinolenta]|nr:hypothetical protein C8R45DRAFT_1081201 [Mycena sanguinolenta]
MSKASEAASEEPAVEFDVLEGFPGSYKAGRSNQWSLDIPWEVTTWATSATTLIPKLWDVCGTTPIGGTPRSSLVVGAGSWGLGRGGWNTPSWWAGSALSTTQTSTNDACASELIGHRRRDGKVGDGRGLLHNGEVARLEDIQNP